MILAICPKCHGRFQARESLANRRIKCPQCQTIFNVGNRQVDPFNPLDPTKQTLPTSNRLLESSPSFVRNYREEEEEFFGSRNAAFREDEAQTDPPGVISLIIGCLAMLSALFGLGAAFGFLTFGVLAYVAVPFALMGGLIGFFGKGNLRVAGLLLNFLSFIPAVIVTVILIVGFIATKEREARRQEEERQRQEKIVAESQRAEAAARARAAETERLNQQAALKAEEARLLEQRRIEEQEEEARRRRRAREQEELRALMEQRRREVEARQKEEQAAKEKAERQAVNRAEEERKTKAEAEREAARKTEIEKKGLPYYPLPRTEVSGHNAEQWYQVLRDNPVDSRMYVQATASLAALKEEGMPFLLDHLSRQTTPKARDAALRLIPIEYVHSNDLHKLLPFLDRAKNFQTTRLLALQWLEKRARDLKRDLVSDIERLVEDMLDNPNYKEATKEEIRSRLKTISREARSQ